MDSITGVMDMDGFIVEKLFYCKELAMIKKNETYATSILSNLGLEWSQLNEKDKKSACFLEKYIHKILFNSPSTVPVSNLPQIVRRYFSKPETLVAYKGGQFEKNLLDQQIGIPSVNLENCGHHLTPNTYHHCLKVKVEAFAMWLW